MAKTATLTVNPAGPAALAGVAMNPATMIFGSVSTGTVTLTAPAPAGGAVIALYSPDYGLFYLPASSVTVRRHDRSVLGDQRGRAIDDVHQGELQRCEQDLATADIHTSPTVTALTCTPNPIIGGNPTVCTVTMNGIMVENTPVSVLFGPAVIVAGASGWLISMPQVR